MKKLLFLIAIIASMWQGAEAQEADAVWARKSSTDPGIVKFTMDSKKIVTCYSPYVKIWDVETGTVDIDLNDGKFESRNIRLSKGGKYLAIDSEFGTRIYEVGTWKFLRQFGDTLDKIIHYRSYGFDISPDEKVLARVDGGRTIKFYDIETGNLINKFSFDLPVVGLYSLNYSPDGKRIYLITYELEITNEINYLRVIDANDYKTLFKGREIGANPLEISHNGNILSCIAMDNKFIVCLDLNSDDFKVIHSISANQSIFRSKFCFSPDDKYILYTDNLQLKVLNLKTNEEAFHYGSFINFDISSNGNFVVAATHDYIMLYGTPWYPSSVEEDYSVINIQITPNPIDNNLTLRFYVQKDDIYKIYLTDITGKTVKTIDEKLYGFGEHSLIVGTSDIPSGVYFLVIESKSTLETVKFVKR